MTFNWRSRCKLIYWHDSCSVRLWGEKVLRARRGQRIISKTHTHKQGHTSISHLQLLNNTPVIRGLEVEGVVTMVVMVEWVDDECESEDNGEPEIDNTIRQYLAEIGRYPLLTAEQELQLTRRVADGDTLAMQQLIEATCAWSSALPGAITIT